MNNAVFFAVICEGVTTAEQWKYLILEKYPITVLWSKGCLFSDNALKTTSRQSIMTSFCLFFVYPYFCRHLGNENARIYKHTNKKPVIINAIPFNTELASSMGRSGFLFMKQNGPEMWRSQLRHTKSCVPCKYSIIASQNDSSVVPAPAEL